MRNSWPFVLSYILGALFLSLPVHLGCIDVFHAAWLGDTMFADMSYLWAGIGPFLAGLIAIQLHKGLPNRILVLGVQRLKNMIMIVMPVIVFALIGLPDGNGVISHSYGFAYVTTITMYALLEEFGWRRYLQNALEGLNTHLKYVFIGIVWWIWHARFETLFDLTLFPMICVGGGYVLGRLADDSASIIPVAMMHMLIILLTSAGDVSMQAGIGCGFVLAGWFLLEKAFPERDKQTFSSQD